MYRNKSIKIQDLSYKKRCLTLPEDLDFQTLPHNILSFLTFSQLEQQYPPTKIVDWLIFQSLSICQSDFIRNTEYQFLRVMPFHALTYLFVVGNNKIGFIWYTPKIIGKGKPKDGKS